MSAGIFIAVYLETALLFNSSTICVFVCKTYLVWLTKYNVKCHRWRKHVKKEQDVAFFVSFSSKTQRNIWLSETLELLARYFGASPWNCSKIRPRCSNTVKYLLDVNFFCVTELADNPWRFSNVGGHISVFQHTLIKSSSMTPLFSILNL